MDILLTGATGYVGGKLLPRLLDAGHTVRCLARDPAKAQLPAGADVRQGDVVSGEGVAAALDGADVAYYLVHSMGGSGHDFVARDRQAASTFARAAKAAGVGRVIYLGGLESDRSEHLRSRHEVAEILRREGPPLVYVRAAMVIGSGSASFQMLEHLVRRLPVMVTPRWIDTRSQPVAIGDVTRALCALAAAPDAPDEVQLGGADVLTYREMMQRFARVLGRRPPAVVRVPMLSPRLSSYWVALVTPIDLGMVRPLVDGLSAEMLVRTPPPAGINDAPAGFDDAVRQALAP
ncbi:MAG TPA: NAD(P)H-binding protein [Capillimicrobium sp.]